MHSIFGLLAGQMAMVSAAADRLIAVMCPMMHTQLTGSTKYLAVHTGLAIACGASIAVYAQRFSMSHPFLPVTGYISDLLVLDMEMIALVSIQILCAINIVLYVLVWVVVKKRSSTISNKEPQEKLFKSLVVIIGIVIGGYVFNNIFRLVSNHWLQHNDVVKWWANVFGGIILNIGASAETPALYIFSTDYRSAINKVLARFICCGCLKKNAQNSGILASACAVTRVNAVTVAIKMPHRISLNSNVHHPNIVK
uniref:Vomeronasal type-1 receptor n=1 Tax=Globodera rostochiensis TaxID=31243 RepID=A0A914I1M2_GLORO